MRIHRGKYRNLDWRKKPASAGFALLNGEVPVGFYLRIGTRYLILSWYDSL